MATKKKKQRRVFDFEGYLDHPVYTVPKGTVAPTNEQIREYLDFQEASHMQFLNKVQDKEAARIAKFVDCDLDTLNSLLSKVSTAMGQYGEGWLEGFGVTWKGKYKGTIGTVPETFSEVFVRRLNPGVYFIPWDVRRWKFESHSNGGVYMKKDALQAIVQFHQDGTMPVALWNDLSVLMSGNAPGFILETEPECLFSFRKTSELTVQTTVHSPSDGLIFVAMPHDILDQEDD